MNILYCHINYGVNTPISQRKVVAISASTRSYPLTVFEKINYTNPQNQCQYLKLRFDVPF
ncbi:hypothetical protein PIROE2DRAFT_13497 [Piromyces sp. E2]|nr:hypothetical protein PIROE2DRAFT_13497 [Piromyces sp. E2]|eukprot:OUM60680.1 hypothetical protein PIROE2DRAFT_13497 [Piromyces sp. E2]